MKRIRTNILTSTILVSLLAFSFLTILATPVRAADSSCTTAGSTGLTAAVVATNGQKITGTIDATGCDVGVYVGPGTTHVTITKATISGANDHGIFVQDAKYIWITNNVVTGNQVNPHPDCPAGAPPSTGCIAEDKAVELAGTSFSILEGNTVSYNNGSPGGGIGIADDGAWDPGAPFGNPGNPNPGNYNLVSNNNVNHNLADCQIVVAAYNAGEGVSHNIVSGNTIAFGVTGIVVAADSPSTSATYNLVFHNTVSSEFIPGIIIHSNTPGDVVSYNDVIGNTLSNNGPDGEVGDSSNTGILLAGQVTPVTHSVVSLNKISSEDVGIWVCNAVASPMLGNHFKGVSTPISTMASCP